MFFATYECIICDRKWRVRVSNSCDGISSGICPECFRANYKDLVHRRQRRESAFDCFGSATTFCDQSECAFRFACVPECVLEWKRTLISNEERKPKA